MRSIIIALIPLALRGVQFKPLGAARPAAQPAHLRLGGSIVPFIGIKVIDLIITALDLV